MTIIGMTKKKTSNKNDKCTNRDRDEVENDSKDKYIDI